MKVDINIVEGINYHLKLSYHLLLNRKLFTFFSGISRCCGFTVLANSKQKPIQYLLEGAPKISLFIIVKPLCHVG